MTRFICAALLATAAAAVPARAGFVVTVSDATVDARSSAQATVDVRVRFDEGTHDLGLINFGLRLVITRLSPAGSGGLQFSASQPDPFNDDNYLFAGGRSGAQDFGLPLRFNPDDPAPLSPGVYAGSDWSLDFSPTLFGKDQADNPLPTEYLLMSLDLDLIDPSAIANGTKFSISVVNPSSETYFTYGDDTLADLDEWAFDAGTVTVMNAAPPTAVVPAPPGIVLAAIGAVSLAALRRLRRPVEPRTVSR